MKWFLAALIFFMTLANAAAASDELDATEIRLVCAICSMGAYSADESYLMRSVLTSRGWVIEKLSRKNNLADAKAYLVGKGDVKILTIAGTENLKDVEFFAAFSILGVLIRYSAASIRSPKAKRFRAIKFLCIAVFAIIPT